MNIEVILNPGELTEKSLRGKTVVVFDALRATSTIVTALANGCRAVIPAEEIDEAKEIARALKEGRYPGEAGFLTRPGSRPAFPRQTNPDCRQTAGPPETASLAANLPPENILLGGERGGERVPGFPHGNSPLEYTPEAVTGKVLVLTTTNGTRAIRRAAREAFALYAGSLLNARAVARELQRRKTGVALVCAGTNGDFSLEDALAAGMVIKETLQFVRKQNEKSKSEKYPEQEQALLSGRAAPGESKPMEFPAPVNLSDAATAVYRLALWYGNNPAGALRDSRHGQKLLRLGLAADLEYCSRLNLFDLVPVYQEGSSENKIKKANLDCCKIRSR